MNDNSTSTPLRAGHLVMVDIEGTALDASTADFLRQHQIRAVCLFRKNLGTEAQIRQLTSDLRAAMGDHALIAIDQEGGSVARVLSLPQAPAAMALGAVNDEELAEQVGAAVSRGLRSLGINWNFAPVLDINNNPENPVIAERSFGEDSDRVVRLAGAWMRGAMREGVACCVKHFPGHGDTHVDSHHALPTVDKSWEQLEELELRPFRALGSVAPAVMTAHIVYPQIDPDFPATLSKKVLTGILRQSLGYGGVIITDALMMRAIYDRYGHARSAVLALQAGADMVLAQGSHGEQMATLMAIETALSEGGLQAAELLRSRQRLTQLVQCFPLQTGAYAASQRAADESLMFEAWRRALTCIGGAQPPGRNTPLRVITQRSVNTDGVSESGLPAEQVRKLFEGFADVEVLLLDDLRELEQASVPQDGRINVLVSNMRKRYLRPGLAVDLHLALWNPFQVLDIAAPAVVTWGYAQGALAAVRDWLQGSLVALASAPVPLNAAPKR